MTLHTLIVSSWYDTSCGPDGCLVTIQMLRHIVPYIIIGTACKPFILILTRGANNCERFKLLKIITTCVSRKVKKIYELTQNTLQAQGKWRSTALTGEWRIHYSGHDYLFREVKIKCQVPKEETVAEWSLESQIHLTLASDVKLNREWCTLKRKIKQLIEEKAICGFLCTFHTDSIF